MKKLLASVALGAGLLIPMFASARDMNATVTPVCFHWGDHLQYRATSLVFGPLSLYQAPVYTQGWCAAIFP